MNPEDRLAAMLAALGYDITPNVLREAAGRAAVMLINSTSTSTSLVHQHIIWHNTLSAKATP